MRRDTSVDVVIDRVMAQADQLGIVLSRQGFALTLEEARDELRARCSLLFAQADIVSESFSI
jgi:hypothetical protein